MNWNRATSRDFSFGGSRTPENVGPGTYNVGGGIQTPRSQSACFKSGNYSNRDIFSVSSIVTPSPCDYQQTTQQTRLSITSGFKSRTKRELFTTSENPGPCEHSTINNWGKTAKSHSKAIPISKLSRERPISGNVGQDILGYEIDDDGTVLHAVKKFKHGSEWVGPGSYSPENPGTASPRYHSLRECYRNENLWGQNGTNFPGPGSYSPDNPDQRYMRKISSKYEKSRIEPPKSDGLAQKDWSRNSKRTESSTFKSKSSRKIYETGDETPSPATYNLQNDSSCIAHNRMNAAAFGQKSPRFDSQKVEGPGPGEYEGKTVKWGKKGSSLVRRAVDKYDASNDVPGPGSYRPQNDWLNTNELKRRPTSSFASNSKRGWDDSNENPGPGSYNLRKKSESVSRNKNTIHASRFKETNNFMYNPYMDNPSPADYQRIESPLEKKRGRSISRSDRFNYKQNDNPGPGAFEVVHSSFIKKSCHVDYRGLS